MAANSAGRRKWALTQQAFDTLLAAFDGDREAAGEKYLEVRNNLLRFFEWRGCPFPEDHADETIRLEWLVIRVTRNAKLGGDVVELRGRIRGQDGTTAVGAKGVVLVTAAL